MAFWEFVMGIIVLVGSVFGIGGGDAAVSEDQPAQESSATLRMKNLEFRSPLQKI